MKISKKISENAILVNYDSEINRTWIREPGSTTPEFELLRFQDGKLIVNEELLKEFGFTLQTKSKEEYEDMQVKERQKMETEREARWAYEYFLEGSGNARLDKELWSDEKIMETIKELEAIANKNKGYISSKKIAAASSAEKLRGELELRAAERESEEEEDLEK